MNRLVIATTFTLGICAHPATAQLVFGFSGGLPRMWDVNPETGAAVPVFNTTQYVYGLAAAPNGVIYLSNPSGLSRLRYGIASEPEFIGNILADGVAVGPQGLAFGNGRLYGSKAAIGGGIYEINLTNASASLLCSMPPPNGIFGLDFNSSDGRLYGLISKSDLIPRGLYTIDIPIGGGACTYSLVAATPSVPGLSTKDYEALAIGDGRAFWVPRVPGPILIYNFATSAFEAPLSNPNLYATSAGGAAYVPEPGSVLLLLGATLAFIAARCPKKSTRRVLPLNGHLILAFAVA